MATLEIRVLSITLQNGEKTNIDFSEEKLPVFESSKDEVGTRASLKKTIKEIVSEKGMKNAVSAYALVGESGSRDAAKPFSGIIL